MDDLPTLEEGPAGGRMLVHAGVLVLACTVCGLLLPDDSIELIVVTIEPYPPPA